MTHAPATHIPEYVFDLDGGRACLDFANTLSATSGEHLNSYADLIAFAAQSDLLTPEDADWLRAEGRRDALTAEGVVVRARRLRASLYALFSALAAGKAAPERELDHLNSNLAASMSHARVLSDAERGHQAGQSPPAGAESSGYRWGFIGRNLDAPLWPIIRSAADLLTSRDELQRVRECTAEDCHWLFLDTTRNRSRQWCSMGACGNRQKARRHYQRIRDLQRSAASSAPVSQTLAPTSSSAQVGVPIVEGGGGVRRGRGRAGRRRAGPAGGASARAE
jgi:predicted RNA-binding Zn ribbon-like protein